MKYLEEAILELLRQQRYRQVENTKETPFTLLYKENGDSLLMIAVINKNTEQGILKLDKKFFDNLKQMMKIQTQKSIIFSYWVILAGEPDEEDRKLALEVDNIWFIDAKEKREYIFDEVNAHFLNLYKQLDALLTGNLKKLKKIQREERKKQYKKEWEMIRSKMTPANTGIVFLNILIFLFIELSGTIGELLLEAGVMDWRSICFGGEYYRMVSCMFLHFGISHLFNNMLFLFLIGSYLERVVGTIRYLILYFGAGVGSSLVSLLYYRYQNDNVASAGASGALFGVVGALLYIIIRNKGRLEELSWRSFLFMIVGTISVGFFTDGVDNAAHVGGLIAGFLLAIFCYFPRRKNKWE
ncbi:MAG: rhomboid family intramembrane serine protease [Lachnospiraceae bacterium]